MLLFFYEAPEAGLANIRGTRAAKEYASTEERFDVISAWALNAIVDLTAHQPVEVFIEGYAMQARGTVFDIGENTGVLKHKLFKLGLPLTLVPPTVVKKFATKKGNAKKEGMYAAFVKETGIELMKIYQPKAENVGSPVGDIVDSFYIAKYGYTRLAK